MEDNKVMTQFLQREQAADLAYIYYEGTSNLPAIVFLGGFCSDMMGSKASFLAQECEKRQQSYLRFDYTGHGQSSGDFEQGCISDWAQDARDVIDHCLKNMSFILIGSSMGGWISLLLARDKPANLKALIGIATAPDFTTWMERDMNDEQRESLNTQGYFKLPSDYGEPYVITKKLIDDGRQNILLNGSLDIQVPVRLLQGRQDQDVPWQVAETIKSNIQSDDVQIFCQEEGDHSLSSPEDLDLLNRIVKELSEL